MNNRQFRFLIFCKAPVTSIHLYRLFIVKRLDASVDRQASEFLIMPNRRCVFVQLNCSNLRGTCLMLSSRIHFDQYTLKSLNEVNFGFCLLHLKI